jgi:hypothetical protein
MSFHRRRDAAQIELAAEQRRREHDAPRLHQAAPTLLSLRLTFDDRTREDAVDGVHYAKPIVVATAPAYFDVRCAEPRCDGRHDLTESILSALRSRLTSSSGRSSCNGAVGTSMCNRTLDYACSATFR